MNSNPKILLKKFIQPHFRMKVNYKFSLSYLYYSRYVKEGIPHEKENLSDKCCSFVGFYSYI